MGNRSADLVRMETSSPLSSHLKLSSVGIRQDFVCTGDWSPEFGRRLEAGCTSRGKISGETGAAKKVGIPPSTLEFRIKKLRIDKLRYRRGWRRAAWEAKPEPSGWIGDRE